MVVLADEHSATGSAVAQLRENLPAVRLRARPRPLDARVTAVLADHGYGRELEMLPAPGGGGSLALIEVDARGAPARGDDSSGGRGRGRRGRAREGGVPVVCGSPAHAEAVGLALCADPRTRSLAVRVVALGDAAGNLTHVVLRQVSRRRPTGRRPSLGVLSSGVGASAVRQAIVASTRDVVVVTALGLGELGAAAATPRRARARHARRPDRGRGSGRP